MIITTPLQSEAQIRSVLRNYGRLNQDAGEVDSAADLYQRGLTSHASVNVMLALEAAFQVEFPDHMLKRNVFSSIDSISRAIGDLTAA